MEEEGRVIRLCISRGEWSPVIGGSPARFFVLLGGYSLVLFSLALVVWRYRRCFGKSFSAFCAPEVDPMGP